MTIENGFSRCRPAAKSSRHVSCANRHNADRVWLPLCRGALLCLLAAPAMALADPGLETTSLPMRQHSMAPAVFPVGVAASSPDSTNPRPEMSALQSAVPSAAAATPQGAALRTEIESLSAVAAPSPATTLPQGITLDDAERMALENHPALRRASARLEAARGRWVQVGLPPNLRVGYQGSEIGNSGLAGQQGGTVGQMFITGGKLRLNRAVAAQEIRQAQQQVEAWRYRVLNEVRLRFYDVLAAQRTVELAGRLIRITEDAVKMSSELLRSQEGSRVDVLQAQVEADRVRILWTNAQNRYQSAWRSFAAAVANPQLAPVPLLGQLEPPPTQLAWQEALLQLATQSPELRSARLGVERARWALRRAQAEPIPNLNSQAGVAYDHETQDTIVGVQFQLPLPIINRNQGGIRQARGELSAARSEVARVELDLQQRLAAAFERYTNASNQVARYSRDILPRAQRTLDLVMRAYQQGEYGYLNVLTAQRTYFQASLAYVESLRQLRASQIAIEGLLLVEPAASDPGSLPMGDYAN